MKTLNIAITTPALLFPAISLLLLAYTNRFLTTGQLIRGLSANARSGKVPKVSKQIKNLKKRVYLIKIMQLYGVASLIFCTISMFLIFLGKRVAGEIFFGISLVTMIFSLIITLYEIFISVDAINYEIESIKKYSKFYEKNENKEPYEDEKEDNSLPKEIKEK